MCARGSILLLGLAIVGTAQESQFPPGILLLSRIKRHMRQEIGKLPDYTCLETLRRSRRAAGSKGEMKLVDTLRMEILYSERHEMYAAAGDLRFRGEIPSSVYESGMRETGSFGGFLQNIFVNDVARFIYRGEERIAGRRAVRYDLLISEMMSGYTVSVPAASGKVAIKGSFWADPESLDLLRLEVDADEIPPNLQVIELKNTIQYARTRVGADDVLLAQSGEMRLLESSGAESVNSIEFTHCRAYRAESTISFETPVPVANTFPLPASALAAPEEEHPIPAGLAINLALATEIDEKARLGAVIEARIAGNVTHKGRVIIEDGSLVRGRIRILEPSGDGHALFVGLEFIEIESAGMRQRFYADLQSIDPTLPAEIPAAGGPKLPAGDLPGIGLFLVQGTTLRLQKGFKMGWRTRPLADPQKPFSPRAANR